MKAEWVKRPVLLAWESINKKLQDEIESPSKYLLSLDSI